MRFLRNFRNSSILRIFCIILDLMLSKHIQIRSSNRFQRSKRIARGFIAGGVFYNIGMITFLPLITLKDLGKFSISLENQRFFLISIILTGKHEASVLLSSAARVSSYVVDIVLS